MNWITETLAVGRFLDARDPDLLAEHGITGVLCLAKDRITKDQIPGVEKDAWPLIDGTGNSVWDLNGALKKLDRLLSRHERVIVHCNAGKSRSCALVAAHLVRHKGLSVKDALSMVAEKRPQMAVAEGLVELLEAAL